MTDFVWSLPHHDGSETYVPEANPRLGGQVSVFLRVPKVSDVTRAWVRVLADGEPELVRATVDREDANERRLRAELPVINPVVSYRCLLDGGRYARIPMPWEHPERWDQRRLSFTQALYGTHDRSTALRRGGLRWLAVSDDALTFLREAPGETILVHAARADHLPVRLPVSVVGSELEGLAGTAGQHADSSGQVTLPAHGPAFSMWRLTGS